ncbi:MAG: ABC transporter permease [Campylobacterales bacterium]
MSAFIAVLSKELFVFLRSWGLVFVVLFFFLVEVFAAGNGITLDARHIRVGIVDDTPGVVSTKLTGHLHAPQFQPPRRYASQAELMQAIRNKEVIVGLLFDRDFERNVVSGKPAQINILLDATATTQSFMALSYLQNIVLQFEGVRLPIGIAVHKLYNPNGENRWFMSVTEMLAVATMLSIILTAVIFVKEKEHGTWDIMLLMPVDPKVMILAKTLSQVIIVTAGIMLSTAFVLFGSFDVPMNGSFAAFFLLALLYAFTNAGIGLFIASVSKNTVEIAQKSVVIVMPMIFLSGSWTPIFAMHPFFQYLSVLSPLRYFIEGTINLFFRGTPALELWPQFLGFSLLAVLLYGFGIRRIGKLF